MRERPYYVSVWKELDARKRMILLSGPRQSGKTTFAKAIGSGESSWLYFNYDVPSDRQTLLKDPAFFQKVDRARGVLPLIVLDEIHKYKDWKNYLKGAYDGYADGYRFLVTGSGRLDLYQRRGDSLAGRYWQFHLFPFTIGELFADKIPPGAFFSGLADPPALSDVETSKAWAALGRFSGFPEPFVAGEERTYNRWGSSYHRQVLREDVRDAFAVKQIDTMESLYLLLPDRVGSSFSASSCAELLRVSHTTISSWIEVFKRFYLVFTIRPYHRKVGRSLVKEPKLYFYDFTRVRDEAARFENMVALELARATSLWTDLGIGDFGLWYLRTREKREIDFLVTKDARPLFMVEAKTSETEPSKNIAHFQGLLDIPAIQVVNRPGIARVYKEDRHTTLVVSAARWLAGLG
jgi:predicted AAA+ superfamily ATPase